MPSHQGQGIREGQQGFGIPGGLTNRKGWVFSQLMSKHRDQGNNPQPCRSRALNSHIRPRARSFHPKMRASFMEGDLNWPTLDKPWHDLDAGSALIGPKPCLGRKFALRITQKLPAERHGNNPGMGPQGGARSQRSVAANASLPVDGDHLPDGFGINEAFCQRRLTFPFHRWSPVLVLLTWRCRVGETRIQTHARDHDDSWQADGCRQKCNDRRGSIGHQPQRASRQPSMPLLAQLSRPIGDGLVRLSLLLVRPLAGSKGRQKRQSPNATSPRKGSQQHQEDPSAAPRV